MNKDSKEQPLSAEQGAVHLQGGSVSMARSSSWQELGTAGLALFLYLLLMDAAVETFLSGAPVRWWVTLVVATYLGGSAVLWWRGHPLWQRAGWATTITISFFILTGLLGAYGLDAQRAHTRINPTELIYVGLVVADHSRSNRTRRPSLAATAVPPPSNEMGSGGSGRSAPAPTRRGRAATSPHASQHLV